MLVTLTNANNTYVDPIGQSNEILALDGNDTVRGENGDDTVRGGNGADSLLGGDGLDFVYGDDGNDRLFGGNGNDQLFGGIGNDTLAGDANNDTLNGGVGADSMNGGANNDLIISADGQDTIVTGTGSDTVEYSLSTTPRTVTITDFAAATDTFVIRGEYQPYTVSASGPPTTVTFANGDVVVFNTLAPAAFAPIFDLTYGDVDVNLTLGNGADKVTLGTAPVSQYLNTKGGDDVVVSAGAPNFGFILGDGNDSLTVTGMLGGAPYLQGIDVGAGNDTISLQDVDSTVQIDLGEGANSLTVKNFLPAGGQNSEAIYSGSGNDTITIGAFTTLTVVDAGGNNTIKLGNQYALAQFGTVTVGAGDDVVVAGNVVNTTFALGDGANKLTVGDGLAQVTSGIGNDTISMDAGNQTITTGAGADSVTTGAGNSSIATEAGNDTIAAGGGDDTLSGGADNDVLTGGTGVDLFVYEVLTGGLDRITDYQSGVDTIQIGGFDPAFWGTDGLGNGTYTAAAGNVLTVVGITDASLIIWA